MQTEKLYHNDSYIREFSARVVEEGIKDGLHYVVLDKTAFYPEGGGQPWDLGHLNGVSIIKVLEGDDGVIYHYIEHPLKDSLIRGVVDWNRRRDHMQQHLGQHILSGAFETLLGAATVGFHLGQDYVSIDVVLESFDNELMAKVEDLANKIIWDNLDVKVYIVQSQDIKDIPMRKPPKVEEDIRIVEVDSFDYSGCGGTHPKSTGEVGMIKITRWEKSRGNIRIEFLCGDRALRDYRTKNHIIYQCASAMSLQTGELKEGIDRLSDEVRCLTRLNKQLKSELNQYKAAQYYDKALALGGVKIIREVFENGDLNDIKFLASSITSNEKVVVLFGNRSQKAQLLFSCSKDVDINMSQLLKEVLPLVDGTGGGSPTSAQGGGSSVSNIEQALIAAHQIIQNRYLK